MAAVQDSDPVAARTDARRRTAFQGLVFLTAAGGLALTLLVFYPGYSTVDARYVYADAQAWRPARWPPPKRPARAACPANALPLPQHHPTAASPPRFKQKKHYHQPHPA